MQLTDFTFVIESMVAAIPCAASRSLACTDGTAAASAQHRDPPDLPQPALCMY